MLWNAWGWGCGPGWHRPWRPYRPMGCGCAILVPILILIGITMLCGLLGSCMSWYDYGWYYF